MRALLLLVVAILLAGCAESTIDAASVETDAAPGAARDPAAALLADVEAAIASNASVNVSAMRESDLLGFGLLSAPRSIPVVLRPSDVLAAQPWAEVDGARVEFPDVRAFEGTVAHRPDAPVRLTFGDGWARGTVRFNDTLWLVRVGLDGNLPYDNATTPAARFSQVGSAAPVPYDRDGQEEHECLMAVPEHVATVAEPLEGPTSLPPLTALIVLDADAQFGEALGRHTFPMMVAFLQEVDAIYDYEVGIRFQLVGLHLNTNASYYPDPEEEEAPLARAAEFWNARPDVDRDVVHVFTGQDSSYAMANCIGGAGHPDIAYTFTPLNWARDSVVFHEAAFAHELGHIFSAHHHYGNHVEAMWNNNRLNPMGQAPLATMPQGGLATIMIQGYTPGTKPVFGTLEKSVIRGWAENEL